MQQMSRWGRSDSAGVFVSVSMFHSLAALRRAGGRQARSAPVTDDVYSNTAACVVHVSRRPACRQAAL